MRALIISDVHSNLEALQAVLEDARRKGGFDEVWCLGDLVGYGPDPGPCIDLLRSLPLIAVAGNHDLAAVGRLGLEEFNPVAAEANRWTARRLRPEHAAFLASLPLRIERDDFILVHGSPRDPVWEYVGWWPDPAGNFQAYGTHYCLVGHSHTPFLCLATPTGCRFEAFQEKVSVSLAEERLILNPGSVGQPRDGDPRSSYAVLESQARRIELHRVDYNLALTQTKIREAGLPAWLAERLAQGQ
ncbi:MAG: metallophosphoesterase family protein [Chloroflexi bacterium]|nr:metallophosphoesterase family protein [Chloroflexota bacterium]